MVRVKVSWVETIEQTAVIEFTTSDRDQIPNLDVILAEVTDKEIKEYAVTERDVTGWEVEEA